MGTSSKNQSKILRMGIVQAGRIIEERLLRHREAVTVGQSPKNKFMVPLAHMPVSYKLVELTGGLYYLCFEKGMMGKVVVGDEVLDLKAIAQRGLAVRKGNSFHFKLDDDMRGKIVIGDVTFLFQFVTPPPPVPRLQLPAAVRGAWWRNTDPAIVVTLLLCLASVGTVFWGSAGWWVFTGRYMATARVANPRMLQALVQAHQVAVEDPATKKDDQKDEEADEKVAEVADKGADKSNLEEMRINEGGESQSVGDSGDLENLEAGPGGPEIDTGALADRVGDAMKGPENVGRPDKMSDEDRMARAKSIVSGKTVVGVLGSDFGAGGGGFSDALADGHRGGGNDFGGDLVAGGGGLASDYLEEGDGLSAMAAEMGGPGGGFGPGGPGGGGGPVFEFKNVGPDKGPQKVEVIDGPKTKLEAVKAEPIKERKFDLVLSEARGVTGKIDKGELNKYLRARQSALQQCFIQVARKNPNAGGKLTLRILIDLSGRATAKVVTDQTGDSRLAECIIGKLKGWTFPKPEGKPAEFTVPFVFRAQ
jgi:hypothetical protein